MRNSEPSFPLGPEPNWVPGTPTLRSNEVHEFTAPTEKRVSLTRQRAVSPVSVRRHDRRLHPFVSLVSVLALAGIVSVSVVHVLQNGTGGVTSLLASIRGIHESTKLANAPTAGFEESIKRLAPAVPPQQSTNYAFMDIQNLPDGTQAPVLWDPCRPIHIVVNPTGAPDGFTALVQQVAAEISTSSGLVIRVDGTTQEVAGLDRAPYQPTVYGDQWAPVLVAAQAPEQLPQMEGDAGLSRTSQAMDPADGRWHRVSGEVFVSTTLNSGDQQMILQVLRHEMMHLVGLDHVDDPAEVMYPNTDGAKAYGPGDIAGLAEIGRGTCAAGL